MSDDSDSISFLARQREASQREEEERKRTAEFYGALIGGDTQGIYCQLGISPPSVKIIDGVGLIDDPELERMASELDALPEPDVRRLIITVRDEILRRIDQSDVISSTLKDAWQRSLRFLPGDGAPAGPLDVRLPTELILVELGRLLGSIEDEHTKANMRIGGGGNLWTSATRERMLVDSDFQPMERGLSDLVYLLRRHRSRFGKF